MYTSEAIINNLLIEVDSLNIRIKNIKQAYWNTSHYGLRERLIYEKQNIFNRLNEIFSIAKLLEKRTNEKVNFSNLLLEKCRRTISEIEMRRDLFFL